LAKKVRVRKEIDDFSLVLLLSLVSHSDLLGYCSNTRGGKGSFEDRKT